MVYYVIVCGCVQGEGVDGVHAAHGFSIIDKTCN